MNPELRSHAASFVLRYLRDLSIRDVLTTSADILIVYYVIYRVLKLIRGTRAAQMLVGMMLVAALFAAAKRFELTTVSWLFENLINYLIIFLIVIFQQDIRRGLMQVGQNLWRRQQYEETYVIEEVVQASDELSRRRIGGLIVLERDADLADHLGEVGIALDAKVTKELLVTLFIPDADNHMHDGAVIIKNLRVQQAGAVLPLSANAKLDKQLGTRHRAAIGITEETDAVVVVVSEERGAVSLCFNGNIARDLAPATLRKALLGLFQKKNKGKGGPARPARPGRGPTPVDASLVGDGDGEGSSVVPAVPRKDPTPVLSRERMSSELMSLVVTQPLQRPPSGTALSDSGEKAPAPSTVSLRPSTQSGPAAGPQTGPISTPGLAALQIATPAQELGTSRLSPSGIVAAALDAGPSGRVRLPTGEASSPPLSE